MVDGVERLTRCDCWRRDLIAGTLKDARIPPQYAHAELSTFEERGSNLKREAYRAAVKFAEAPARGRSILATSRSSKGAAAYRAVAEHLLERAKG